MPTVKETRIITAGTTWTVPNTWNSSNNSISCIGGGGGASTIEGRGGGGGARATNTNVVLVPGDVIPIQVGAGGAANSTGGYTVFDTSLTPAITLVGTPTTAHNSTTISLPSGLQENDVVFVASLSDTTIVNPVAPTGYTSISSQTTALWSRLSYKIMGSTPDTQATGLAADALIGHMAFAFRNVETGFAFTLDPVSPGPVDAVIDASGTTGSPNPGSITTRFNDEVILAVGYLDDDLAESSVTPPTGYTTIRNFQFGAAESGGTMMSAYKALPFASAENPGAFGIGANTDAWTAVTVGLKPAAVPKIAAAPGRVIYGGTAANSIGQVKYSGGNSNTIVSNYGAGGGAAGNTGNGITPSSLNGGAGGSTDGGNGGAYIAVTNTNEYPERTGRSGWNDGSSNTELGSNYSGGGGARGHIYDDKGDVYTPAGPGGLFGGGGGAGAGQYDTRSKPGAQGAIIVEWEYESVLPTVNTSFSNVNIVTANTLRTETSTISLNDADVRSLAGVPSGAISFANLTGKYIAPTYIATTSINMPSTQVSTTEITLPTWENGDLAIMFLVGYTSTYPIVTSAGWTYLGDTSKAIDAARLYYTGVFTKVLQTGDINLPTVDMGSSGFAGQIAVFRNASRVVARQKRDAVTGTSLSITGITKSSSSRRLITFAADRDPTAVFTAPSGFTAHTETAATNFKIVCASLDSLSYTNGTNVVWTLNAAGTYPSFGVLLEIE